MSTWRSVLGRCSSALVRDEEEVWELIRDYNS